MSDTSLSSTQLIHNHSPEYGSSNNSGSNVRYIQAKSVFFHPEGNTFGKSVRVPVHPRLYKTMDSLLNDLTVKMPELSYGVRSIFTPRGRTKVCSLTDLSTGGRYICSQHENRTNPLDVTREPPPTWYNVGKASSMHYISRSTPMPKSMSNGSYNNSPRRQNGYVHGAVVKFGTVVEDFNTRAQRSRSVIDLETSSQGSITDSGSLNCKQIYVQIEDQGPEQHVLFINKRALSNFEHLMKELCIIFHAKSCKLYDRDGEKVESLSAVFNGSNHFIIWLKPSNYITDNDKQKSIRSNDPGFQKTSKKTKLPPIQATPRHISSTESSKSSQPIFVNNDKTERFVDETNQKDEIVSAAKEIVEGVIDSVFIDNYNSEQKNNVEVEQFMETVNNDVAKYFEDTIQQQDYDTNENLLTTIIEQDYSSNDPTVYDDLGTENLPLYAEDENDEVVFENDENEDDTLQLDDAPQPIQNDELDSDVIEPTTIPDINNEENENIEPIVNDSFVVNDEQTSDINNEENENIEPMVNDSFVVNDEQTYDISDDLTMAGIDESMNEIPEEKPTVINNIDETSLPIINKQELVTNDDTNAELHVEEEKVYQFE